MSNDCATSIGSARARRLVVLLSSVVALLATGFASADSYTGTVSMLEVWRNGNVAFTLSTAAGTCNGQFVINKTADGAKNQYAAVLAAKTSGRSVRVETTASCGPAENYGGSYNIPEYIYVES